MLPPYLSDGARWSGARIGLFGGSFDPPHEGHLHAARSALRLLALDCIWWLIAPQNPLKNYKASDLTLRMNRVHAMLEGQPRMIASTLEEHLGTSTTHDSVKAILRRFPSAHYVWIGGMDSAATLHHWERWQDLLAQITTFYLARPPAGSLVRRSPFCALSGQKHIFLPCPYVPARPLLLPNTTYWALVAPMVEASSTALRTKV